jgi:hypothetical protein
MVRILTLIKVVLILTPELSRFIFVLSPPCGVSSVPIFWRKCSHFSYLCVSHVMPTISLFNRPLTTIYETLYYVFVLRYVNSNRYTIHTVLHLNPFQCSALNFLSNSYSHKRWARNSCKERAVGSST